MCRHEIKQCPRCKNDFECKTNNVLQCQCAGISLTENQRTLIANQYSDCLCADCLHYFSREQNQLDEIIAART